jgi:hypothetical protein
LYPLVISLALAPFVVLAAKDNGYHTKLRKVSTIENLLHLLIGAVLLAGVVFTYRRDFSTVIPIMGLFVICGCIDEFVFHREIPAEEHSIHAKEHLALFAFFWVAGFYEWYA